MVITRRVVIVIIVLSTTLLFVVFTITVVISIIVAAGIVVAIASGTISAVAAISRVGTLSVPLVVVACKKMASGDYRCFFRGYLLSLSASCTNHHVLRSHHVRHAYRRVVLLAYRPSSGSPAWALPA